MGEPGTRKTTILNIFHEKYEDIYKTVFIPVSSFLTLPNFKAYIDKFYSQKRKNILLPKDWRKTVFMIDDLHLSNNLSTQD
jgi:hypothetical protein